MLISLKRHDWRPAGNAAANTPTTSSKFPAYTGATIREPPTGNKWVEGRICTDPTSM